MKIYRLIFIVLIFSSSYTFGQLIERENVQARIAVGTRPIQGNFGFMIGSSIQEFDEILDKDLDIQGFPLMSFKYYFRDHLELRLSSQIYEVSEKFNGTLTNELGVEDNTDRETFYRFMPSAHYHFASSNFIDTYVGAGAIIGSEKNEILTNEKINLTGDFVAEHLMKKTFVWGFNINFGLQAFIADLPIAISAEASVRALKHSNLQYENTSQSSVGGIVTEQTYFTLDKNSSLKYQSLEYKTFEMGADLRFMISYYFRK